MRGVNSSVLYAFSAKSAVSISGLVEKMILAGVVEKQDGDLAFTTAFGDYLYDYARRNPEKIGTVRDWLDILYGFNITLVDLSAKEVAALIQLLAYYFDATEPVSRS